MIRIGLRNQIRLKATSTVLTAEVRHASTLWGARLTSTTRSNTAGTLGARELSVLPLFLLGPLASPVRHQIRSRMISNHILRSIILYVMLVTRDHDHMYGHTLMLCSPSQGYPPTLGLQQTALLDASECRLVLRLFSALPSPLGDAAETVSDPKAAVDVTRPR